MAQSARIAEYLEAGLRAASLRQAVIGNNIANMATPGFRRSTVPFEKTFAEALAAGKPIDHKTVIDRIIQPRTGALNEFRNDVQADTEIGDLIQNSMLYKTYVRLLNRTYRQMELAMASDGA
jgi:flagellar basal-body rod protein FlgB